MGKSRTPAWLSKLKQVGEALKVHKGNQSPSYISSPRDSGSGNGDESPGSAFIRRSCEAPELARSLSLRRAKARAAAEIGGRSTDLGADAFGGSSLPSTSTSGHRLSRSIDALYALSQKREEEELAAGGGAGGGHPPASPGHNNRDLDQATMALLASSLSRTKVAKQKELAERAARAAQELKARGARALASDDSGASSDRVALSLVARASSSSSNNDRRKSASDLPRPDWTPDRLRRRSGQEFDSDSIMQQQHQKRYGDAGPSSLCTSEDDRAGDSHLDLATHARTTSMSCGEDAWDNSSRHSRMTGSEDAWEVGAGSWGSDLFSKLRALKQLYSHEGKEEEEEKAVDEEEDDEWDAAAAVTAAGSDFMEDDGWDTSDEASAGEEEEGDYFPSPGPGWATPSTRQQMEASPSRSFVVGREVSSPSRRKVVGTPIPRREDSMYHYGNFESEGKVLWKGDSDGDRKFGTRRRGGGYEANKQQQSNKQNLSCFLPNDVSGVVRESVAMVKYSQDPYVDFRHSMLEMILEKDIHQPADLEELLHCYLTLNSPRQYHLIKEAFFDTWNELLSRRSKTFWGAV